MAEKPSKPNKLYDPAKALARWEGEGGAPRGGRLPDKDGTAAQRSDALAKKSSKKATPKK